MFSPLAEVLVNESINLNQCTPVLKKVQSWHMANVLLRSRCRGGQVASDVGSHTPARTDFTRALGHGLAEAVYCCRSLPQFKRFSWPLSSTKKETHSRHLNFYEVLALLS